MELILAHQDGTQISVTCDTHYSHTFDLQQLKMSEITEEACLLNNPINYGQVLYQALFAPGTQARRVLDSVPERILLITSDEDLDAIPWEYIYAPNGFLVQEYYFVRGLPTEQRIPPPTLDANLHIIAIPSNPLSTHIVPLNIDAEWMRLKEIVEGLPFALTLERVRPPTIKQVRNAVAGQQQRVLHFMGHGGQREHEAVLYFEKENGDLDLVGSKDFALRVRGTTFLVTLNACMSATPGHTLLNNLAAALVRQKIPYALGMRFPIDDEDARLFSRTFYDDLARGSCIEEALLQARVTLASESTHPGVIGIPVLYTSLAAPSTGFIRKNGRPVVIEHQTHMVTNAILRAEGVFRGRIKELKQLGGLLTGDDRPPILTIHGGGGQGKTALARETVERFAHAWPGGVWCTTMENIPDRTLFVVNLAHFLGIDPKANAHLDEIEYQVLVQLKRQRTLIVLDNAETLIESAKANNSETQQLVQFLQQLPSTGACLLITSREQLGWSGEIEHELGGLTPEEGAQLFRQNAPQRRDLIKLSLAQALSKKVEGHPLSLRLLGGAFNATTITLPAFILQCEEQLIKAENIYISQEHRHRKLYACIDTSVCYLNSDQYNLLSGLWIFHAPFLPVVAVAIFDPDSEETEDAPSPVRNLLHTLWQRGLLTYKHITTHDETLHFYYVLPTTRSYIKQHMQSPYSHEVLFNRFGAIYAGIARLVYIKLNHSISAVVIAQQTEEDLEQGWLYVSGTEQIYYKMCFAQIFFRLGTPQRSLKLLEEVLEDIQGQDQHLMQLALNNTAIIYDAIGQPQQALSLYEQALFITREIDDPVGEATTLTNIAATYQHIGQLQQALKLYEQALPILRIAGRQTNEAATLDNMASVLQHIGQTQQALNLYEQALQIKREIGDLVGEAITLDNMAEVYQYIGQPQQALKLLEQALPIRRTSGDRSGEAITLNNMALVYDASGQPQQALNLLEQVLPIRREIGDRQGEAITLNNIAMIYDASGQSQQALNLLEQVLPITYEVGDRLGEAITLNNIALVYQHTEQLQWALNYFEQALLIIREVNNRPVEATTLTNMAVLLYTHLNRVQDAITLMKQTIDMLQQTDITQNAAGRTRGELDAWLQAMLHGIPLTSQTDTTTSPDT